jgi:hypothetical protein
MMNWKDFLKRNLTWVILIITAFIGLGFLDWNLFKTLITSLLMSGIAVLAAIGFSGIAQFCYTKVNFADEHPLSLGQIFMGVCLIISVCLTLFVWFNAKDMKP